jgi:hypothetical protein
MRHANKVVANSDNTRDELLRMGVDPEKNTVIYPGVDIHSFGDCFVTLFLAMTNKSEFPRIQAFPEFHPTQLQSEQERNVF